jgi:UPF0755 protein
MRSIIRCIKFLVWSGLLLAMAGAAGLYYYAHHKFPVTQPITLELQSGSSLKTAAAQLAAVGLLQQPELFVLLARVLGESAKIKAGNYEFARPLSPLNLLQRITRGDVTQVGITFVEGSTFRQMRKALQDNPKIRAETAAMTETELLQKLEIPQPLGEGWFFPDTYYFSAGTSDLAILRRANQLMLRTLNQEWERRAPDLPLKSPMEALILASIVEKETGKPEERGMVAAVFINRLRIGMMLQTDPTVIYGMGESFEGNIRKNDLTTDTPYNTYTRAGLPPTPIAMPGLEALRATLNPPPSDALYFVARGDGTSKFSRTLTEHERAVSQYQRRGRK